jgi:hypothetical protein
MLLCSQVAFQVQCIVAILIVSMEATQDQKIVNEKTKFTNFLYLDEYQCHIAYCMSFDHMNVNSK